MKKKLLPLILFALITCTNIQAQIESEIKNYVDSTEIILNNGRKYLLQCIQDDNQQKVQEIFHFLMMKAEEKNCSAFTYNEQLLLGLIMRDCNALSLLMEEYNTRKTFLCYPDLYDLDNALYKTLKKSIPLIREHFSKAPTGTEEKELVAILIHLVELGSKNQEYDVLIKNYRKKYPSTKFSAFAKNYLPNPSHKTSFSYTFGPKYTFLSPGMKTLFDNNLGLAFSMDFNLSKIYVSMYIEGAAMKLKKNITLSNQDGQTHNFVTANSFNRMDIGFKTGYFLIRNEKIHLAPYLTLLAGGFLESNLYKSENPNYDEFKIYDSFTPGAGVHFEYKLANFKYHNIYQNMNPVGNAGYLSLKLDAGFITISRIDYISQRADMTYLSLGLAMGMGNF